MHSIYRLLHGYLTLLTASLPPSSALFLSFSFISSLYVEYSIAHLHHIQKSQEGMAQPTANPAQVPEGDVVPLSNIKEGSFSYYLNLDQTDTCGGNGVIHN
jgi:hypothetical protein